MTLLLETLRLPNLRQAWNDIAANEGIAGADNVTINQWQRHWEERLIALRRDVATNRYKPGRLRIRRIPKRHAPDWRVLRIPTLTDRVLQRAVLQRLHPICDPTFSDNSFGYRPGRGVADAVRAITRLRRRGYLWVLDADIDDFFNQVDHALLRQYLRRCLPDDSLMPLINQWLLAWRPEPDTARGIAMGAPISPLLANIYLHQLDRWITDHGSPLVRYADDFIVLSRNEAEWQQSRAQVEAALARLRLKLEPRKTRLTTFAAGFDFLGVHFEESWYWYLWDDERIEIHDDEPDPWIESYDPQY